MIKGHGRGVVKRSWVGLAVLVTFTALAFAAPAANAVVVRLPSGRVQGVYLRPGVSAGAYERQTGAAPVTAAEPATPSAPTDNLSYRGGPVLHTSQPYLVFWDPHDAILGPSRAVLTKYLTDAGLDSANANDVYAYRVLAQYYDSTGPSAQGQSFSSAQVISDADAYPTGGCSTGSYTACITDAQIQTELTSLITTKHLPSGIGSNAPIYFVVTPHDVNVCDSGSSCASNEFCAYHSFYTLPSTSTDVVYASIPFTLGTACQSAGPSNPPTQEPNGDVADVIADNLSHENSEAITDPLPESGWLTSIGDEVGDQCEAYGSNDPNSPSPTSMDAYMPILGGTQSDGTLYDQLINGHHYFTQTEWSNADDNCMATPTAGTVTASFAPPASLTPGVSASFDPAASSSTNGYSSTTWSWGDGTANTFHTTSPTTTSHTYAAAGNYTVTLTLVDAGGNTARVSHTIMVGVPVTAAFSASGSAVQVGTPVTFDGSGSRDPNTGESITAYRWSFGDGSLAASGAATSHAYASPGTYTATLTVTGSEGFTATIAHSVTVVAAPSSPPVTSPVAPPAAAPGKIAGVSVKHAKGNYYLVVRVNKAGTVRVRSVKITLRAPGKATFKLSLTRAQRRQLAKHKTVSLRLKITYVSSSGSTVSQTRTVKLKG